jgi:hypothetical protein
MTTMKLGRNSQFISRPGFAPDTTRRHVDLAGIGLNVRQEFGKRLCGERRMHDEDADPSMSARDRYDVADNVEAKLVVERDVPAVGRSKLEQRVTVWRSTNNHLRGKIAARARSVLDNELLTKTLRQPLTEKASEQIGHAARWKPDDQAHRPRRISLCSRDTRKHRQRGSARGQLEKLSAAE